MDRAPKAGFTLSSHQIRMCTAAIHAHAFLAYDDESFPTRLRPDRLLRRKEENTASNLGGMVMVAAKGGVRCFY
jgi:hypothetical protein